MAAPVVALAVRLAPGRTPWMPADTVISSTRAGGCQAHPKAMNAVGGPPARPTGTAPLAAAGPFRRRDRSRGSIRASGAQSQPQAWWHKRQWGQQGHSRVHFQRRPPRSIQNSTPCARSSWWRPWGASFPRWRSPAAASVCSSSESGAPLWPPKGVAVAVSMRMEGWAALPRPGSANGPRAPCTAPQAHDPGFIPLWQPPVVRTAVPGSEEQRQDVQLRAGSGALQQLEHHTAHRSEPSADVQRP